MSLNSVFWKIFFPNGMIFKSLIKMRKRALQVSGRVLYYLWDGIRKKLYSM